MPAPRLDMTVKIMLRNSTSPVCGEASVFRGLLNSPCSVCRGSVGYCGTEMGSTGGQLDPAKRDELP